MKRLTKNFAKELLKDDNYIEALAYFAERYSKCETGEKAMDYREKDFEKLIDWADEFNDDDEFNDYTDNVYRIDSAMFTAISNDYSIY